MSQPRPRRPAHPVPIRIMHWIGVYAIGCMMFSGWEIYNASPSLPFLFPRWAGLGGWLGGALAWHLSAMWLLFVDGLAYIAYGIASGHFRRELHPPTPAAVAHDLGAALRLRLPHRAGHYNAVQRLLYAGVILIITLAVATGLAIWKPVQFGWLTGLFGGYPIARGIHLAMMGLIAGFIIIHVTLVAFYPRTLVSMVANTKADPETAP
ncbi:MULTISPECIES: cytochrome b/b6 domain-containing protein [Acidiphilium]|uniref:Thiosulfate reductase cytochrome b subunit n=1 Tax=Acidiphilium rubrum TaxID=526 RepID=A0A8G2CMV7_ACIRU|nr:MULTISPECIES: cytochrome b/b6 domain-containing protein [Acidiphilium]SIR31798.1 Thiosulfate reductase cytochrome b subunit [Acidiphilium rubrum]